MSSTFRIVSQSLHLARSTRNLSSTARLRQTGHKVYFKQGATTQQAPPIQPQAAPARKNLAGLLWANLILCTAAVYYYTTAAPTEKASTSITGESLPPATDYLSVQTALHNSIGSNITQLLAKVLISVIEGGPGSNYDPIRDTSVWKTHPLRLSDGTKIDEKNAVLIKVYDVAGRFNAAILLVDTYELPRAGGIGALLGRPNVLPKRTQWVDNTTPIQKWIIDIELEERKKAIAKGDPTGISGGMTLIYITRDTCGVGAEGAIDSNGKSDETKPLEREEAMMHCAPIRGQLFQGLYPVFQNIKTDRRGPMVSSGGMRGITTIPQADGSKQLRLPQGDGTYKEVTVRGEIKGRSKVHNTFSLQEPGKGKSASNDKLEMRFEEDESGKTLSARLPNGTWTVISRVGPEGGLVTEINAETRLFETMPNGRDRELGTVKDRDTSAPTMLGRGKGGDIKN